MWRPTLAARGPDFIQGDRLAASSPACRPADRIHVRAAIPADWTQWARFKETIMPAPSLFPRAGLAALAAALLATACTSGPEIRRDVSPAANFGAYKTFAFFPELATDRAGYETVFTARLKDATRRQMEMKGYTYSETDPDLLLNFYANVEDKQEIRSTPASVGFHSGYYGYRGAFGYGISTPTVETYEYKQGTLTIDLVDRAKNALVWNATAEGRVSKEARKNPGPAIDSVVAEMMGPLPGRTGM